MKMTTEQQKLVEENHSLVYFCLRRRGLITEHEGDYCRGDDWYGIACEGLCKAAIAFDESKGKFSTFAVTCIDNELRKAQKFMYDRTPAYIGSVDELLFDDDGNDTTVLDTISSGEDMENSVVSDMYAKNLESVVRSAIETVAIKDRDREILRRILNGEQESKLAREYGLSRQGVNFIKKRFAYRCVKGGIVQGIEV